MGLFDGFKKKKEKKENTDLRAAFAENLKFISRIEFAPEEIRKLFADTENQICMSIGDVDFPTGKIVVADPLAYLYDPEFSRPLNHSVAAGAYPILISVHQFAAIGPRIVAAKLKFTDKAAVRYEIAMPEGKTIEQINEPGVLAGFGVDAGMGCFCDKKTADEYSGFISEWHENNPGKNHYDDYFAAYFAESYRARPDLQREGGDYIVWAIPDTGNRIAMFASGLGDGYYQSLWGFDEEGRICELAVPFINPELFSGFGSSAAEPQPPQKQFFLNAADMKELLNWEGAEGCFATDRIMVDGCKVGYMYREAPDEGRPDSGWRFFAGDESDEYTNDLSHVGIYRLNTIANYDPEIIPFLTAPYGSAFGRDADGVFREE